MIKKFKTYNEALTDKMVAKELNDVAKVFNDVYNEMPIYGFEQNILESKDGIYTFECMDDSDPSDTKFITVTLDDNVWSASIYSGRIRQYLVEDLKADNWSDLFIRIVHILYENIDYKIEEVELEIEIKKKFLENLNKIKSKVKND